jgi:hypothetical protein
MTRKLPTKLRALQESIAEAVKQARLAYRFSPGSYTHSALNACLQTTAGLDAAQRLDTQRCASRPEAQPRLSKATSPTRWDQRRDRRRGGRWRQPQDKSGQV